MPFASGTEVGPYKIIESIGAGGMGEVYKALDTRLDRPVALKILPASLVTDSDRVRRFIGEAKAASALNHPHIITIYEIGETQIDAEALQSIAHYIAMEYVSGSTLHVKIHRENLELKKILEYFAQAADGLAKAHSAGIVHRDLKPENIMISEDGYAKILDFGLAKLVESDQSGEVIDPGEAATAVMDKTRPGVVMGTIGYMSPEQAQGKLVDQRSDIFSFGCILYEAATRKKPFQGDSVIDSLHKIVYAQAPAIATINPDAPAELQRIVRKCLAKDPAERYQSIKDTAIDIRDLIKEYDSQPRLSGIYIPQAAVTQGYQSVTGQHPSQLSVADAGGVMTSSGPIESRPSSGITVAAKGSNKGLFVAGFLVAAIAAAVAAYFVIGNRRAKVSGPAFQNIAISKLTSTGRAVQAAISPDGKYVVHVVNEAGKQSLWVRQTATASNVQIVQPTDGRYIAATFSRDGNYIYFVSCEKGSTVCRLFQVPVLGGTPRKLIEDIDSPASISSDGKRIAFIRHSRGESSVLLASADGSGEQKLITYKQPDLFQQVEWSPDDKTIAASVRKVIGGFRSEMVAINVGDGSDRVIGNQKWLALGGFAWINDGSGVVMTAIDQSAGNRQSQIWHLSYPQGNVRRITNDLNNYSGVSLAADSHSMVTVQADTIANLWLAPEGDVSKVKQITSGSGRYDQISFAPDGRLIYASDASGNPDIWIMDADGKNAHQLTSDSGTNIFPSVSSDGKSVAFCSSRAGSVSKINLWRMGIDGSNPKQLTDGEGEFFPEWSPDNKWILYTSSKDGKLYLSKISADGGDPVQLGERPSIRPVASPDGKWIAFQTFGDQMSGAKLAIMPFDANQPTKLLSIPVVGYRWSSDNKSILYLDDKEGVSNIWSQAIEGGESKQVTKFTTDRIFSFDWSRDGKWMACSRGITTTDVLLIKDNRQAVE